MIDVFCIPNEEIKEPYHRRLIIKCRIYLNLTDTDSCLIFFNFICKKECIIRESESRDLIFEILKWSKIIKRLDLPDEFWEQFGVCDKKLKKQVGLYEIENIDNANICRIDVNPKEYFEKLRNKAINKKHKGVRRDAPGIDFESYAERIRVLREIDRERSEKKISQRRLQVKNTEMKMTKVSKVQFGSLGVKRYYFSDGIVSLPFGHPLLSIVWEVKKSFPKIHTVIKKEKERLLWLKNQAVAKNERLHILRSIYSQLITYYKLNGNNKINQKDSFDFTTTCDYILSSKWL